jgi:Na+-transporting NADH:ubiquinone oxidoreductase subunit NqrA
MKLTQEQIQLIKNIQTQYSDLAYKLGQLELELIDLTDRKANLHKSVLELKTEEIKIASELVQKYGKGTIDIDSGEFIPE